MVFEPKEATRRLVAIGLSPTQASQLTSEVAFWATHSGEEWTVKRLKALKVDYLRHLAGLQPVAEWIDRHKDGSPKGPFGALWKFNRKDLFRCWNALMISSAFLFERKGRGLRMTYDQYQKLIRSIRRQPVEPGALSYANNLVLSAPITFDIPDFFATTGSPLREFVVSSKRRAPTGCYPATVPEEQWVLNSLYTLKFRPAFTARYMDIFDGVIRGIEPFWESYWISAMDAASADTPLVGTLGFIQEPGYKLRYVANPHRVYQQALKPLGDHLFRTLEAMPLDSTYDQEAGVEYCRKQLSEGYRAWSFDLSSATDNFPLSLQLSFLERIGVGDLWRDFFAEVSHGDWDIPYGSIPRLREKDVPFVRGATASGYTPQRMRWTIGQPLGLYPSFASFSLTHHALIRGLFHQCNLEPRYRVLGDDVVIFNDTVGPMYRDLMNDLGVPISAHKTIVSDKLCEFAGRVIFPDRVLRGYKWRGTNDNSFVDVFANLGWRSLSLFRPRQRKVLRVLGIVPEPWGLGFNPKGWAYSDRLIPWIDALSKTEVRVRTYQSKVSRYNQLLYNSHWSNTGTTEGFPVHLTSDQEAREFAEEVLGPVGRLDPSIILPNIEYCVRLFDDMQSSPLGDRLEEARHVLSRFSTLEKACDISNLLRYERLLKL